MLMMALPICTASDATISIDYLEDSANSVKFIYMTNATKSFINCSGNPSDVDLVISHMSNPSGSLLEVVSNNISSTVDYTFVNDTKFYVYVISNATESMNLTVYIDYSSIQVPINPFLAEIANLTSQIENITLQITLLEFTIQNLSENNSAMNATIIEKNDIISSLIIQKNDLVIERDNMQNEWDSMKVERDNAITEVGTLTTANTDLQTTIGTKNNEIDYLGGRVTAYQKSNDQLTNMFALAYTDENGETRPCINIAWLVIGGIISVVCINIHKKRKEFGSSNTIVSMGKRFNIPFLSKGEKPSAKEWDMIESIDKMPSVEKEFLDKSKPKEKESEKESHDSDDREEHKDVKTTQETTKNVPEKVEQEIKPSNGTVKKEDYWKSEKGLAHKARLKELAAGEK